VFQVSIGSLAVREVEKNNDPALREKDGAVRWALPYPILGEKHRAFMSEPCGSVGPRIE